MAIQVTIDDTRNITLDDLVSLVPDSRAAEQLDTLRAELLQAHGFEYAVEDQKQVIDTLKKERGRLLVTAVIPDAYINLYPANNGRMWWTLHDTAVIAYDCEEPGAKFVAAPVCLAKSRKPTGDP